jgi:hypothetical protein
MADKPNDKPQTRQPMGHSDQPPPTHVSQSQRQNEEQARNPAKPPPTENQKQAIADYFRSQGKQDDDVIFDVGGLKLRLKDLA